MQKQFAMYAPRAYQAGKLKVQRKYNLVKPWGERDNANIAVLLSRHAEEVSMSMAKAEQLIATGVSVQDVIAGYIARAGAWSWALFPAMAMGMTASVDDNRQEISAQLPPPPGQLSGQVALVPANDIGIIWHTAGDGRVCKVCDFLNGRWFDGKEAVDLASKVHVHCRCNQYWDVGTPDEALVGPIPDYKPGTAQDIYSNLNIAGLAQARHEANRQELNRVRRQNTPRAGVMGEPITRSRLNKIRRQNIPRAKLPGEKTLANV